MSSLSRVVLLSSLLAVAGLGCGSGGPRVVEVSGTVTHAGKPVENVFLTFVPDHGRASWGVTDDTGHYTLHYERGRPGAVVGTHKVWVQVRPRSPREEGALKIRPELQQILRKYGQNTSALTVEVKENHQVIDLPLD